MDVTVPDKPSKILIDALPYIDEEYTQDTETVVAKMIEDEMRSIVVSDGDYLEDHPVPQLSFNSSEILKTEWNRILASGDAKLPPLDLGRYSKLPPSKSKNPEEWQEALELSKVQQQYQTNRIENLELLKIYGANSWRLYNEHLIYTEKQLQKTVSELKNEIEQINWQRKKEQNEAGEKIKQLDGVWKELVQKNIQIEKACSKLEEQIAALENVK